MNYPLLKHVNDVTARDPRYAEILAIQDGVVLYHRLDIPTHKDSSGRDTHPRRFALPIEQFNARYV